MGLVEIRALQAKRTGYAPKEDHVPVKESGPKPRKSLPKSTKPVNKRSVKMDKAMKEYKPIRRKFLKENPVCDARLDGCTGLSEDVHHSDGRIGGQLLKIEDFVPVCRSCHTRIHDKLSAEKAKEIGLKK